VSRINDPRIRFESPPDSAAIPLNKDAFQQVVLNLLENARKATPPEGQIEVICKKGRTYRISLRDSGEGMSAEVLGKAFDPFYTTRATGSGLGLAITRQLVEQMNGAIHLDSSPGQGTTAILEFPA
ncbi:MAG TPA: ATP-binding protein, partial [Calditrichia bacterium]|nr:ATP-binding protein [Calditrichia bacterium]